VAERSRRRRTSVTRLIGDLVDDTKDLVDDLVDRAQDVEEDARRTARRAIDDDVDERAPKKSSDGRDEEIDNLKSALDDLTAKVNKLVQLQLDAANKPPAS
jgi:polyhydroxyalkanoate synthesis regulator phasin